MLEAVDLSTSPAFCRPSRARIPIAFPRGSAPSAPPSYLLTRLRRWFRGAPHQRYAGKFQPRVCFETLGSKTSAEIARNPEGDCEVFWLVNATQLRQSCVYQN